MFDDFKDDPLQCIGFILIILGMLAICSTIIGILFMLHWIAGVMGIAVAFIMVGSYLIDN